MTPGVLKVTLAGLTAEETGSLPFVAVLTTAFSGVLHDVPLSPILSLASSPPLETDCFAACFVPFVLGLTSTDLSGVAPILVCSSCCCAAKAIPLRPTGHAYAARDG